jgi:hypothetical protein
MRKDGTARRPKRAASSRRRWFRSRPP